MSEKIRVLRVLEYVGDRAAVESHLKLVLQGEKTFPVSVEDDSGHKYVAGHVTIKAATLGVVPETFSEFKLP